MTNQHLPPGSEPVVYESSPPNPGERPTWLAISSLILGLFGLVAWIIPICGCPVHVGGIIFGILGLKSKYRTMAIIGIVLCALCFILTLINAAWGFYLGYTGQHPLINRFK
jgi:hypothetical protein